MTTPYTYRIKHIPSGKNYYGSRFAENCDPSDLWTTYFTSSKLVKELILKDGKESFVAEVRKTFDCKIKCQQYENEVLRRLNVTHNENWLNQYYGHVYTSESQSKGGKNLAEKRSTDSSFDYRIKQKISEATSKLNQQGIVGFKLGHANAAGSIGGKSKSKKKYESVTNNAKKAIEKIKGGKWICNKETGERKRLSLDELNNIPIGWQLGFK